MWAIRPLFLFWGPIPQIPWEEVGPSAPVLITVGGERGYFHEFDFWRIVWYITPRHHCNVAVF
jgi:hypothetical protein